jgi:hypothetical protein
MAPGQSTQREIATFYYPMRGNGIPGIGGTGGMEPAVISQEGAQADLVTGDKENQ